MLHYNPIMFADSPARRQLIHKGKFQMGFSPQRARRDRIPAQEAILVSRRPGTPTSTLGDAEPVRAV